MESGTIPFIMFCATGALWFATWLYAHRLLYAFYRRFPTEAAREIPYAFDRYFAHPKKALFFFRRSTAEIVRIDAALSRQRKRFIVLSVCSVIFPVAWFLPMFVYAVIMS
jgi:hypothetical protein